MLVLARVAEAIGDQAQPSHQNSTVSAAPV